MKNKVISNDLDYIMENYFNTDKEVMYLCDYDTVQEILEYTQYRSEDFSNYFAIQLDCEYEYYSVYKYGDEAFIVEFLTKINGSLYNEYGADTILVQDNILDRYDNIEDLFENYSEIILVNTDEDIDECTECCNMCQCKDCNEEFCEDIAKENTPYTELADILEKYVYEILDTDGCPNCIGDKLLEFSMEILTKFKVQEID